MKLIVVSVFIFIGVCYADNLKCKNKYFYLIFLLNNTYNYVQNTIIIQFLTKSDKSAIFNLVIIIK